MKHFFTFLFILCFGISASAQIVINQKGTKLFVDSSKWKFSGANIYNKNIGNVGIGTTNPAYKLDILGNNPLRLLGLQNGPITDSLVLVQNGIIKKAAPLGQYAWLQNGNNFSATGVLGTLDANDLTFITAGASRMFLDQRGNVWTGNSNSFGGNITNGAAFGESNTIETQGQPAAAFGTKNTINLSDYGYTYGLLNTIKESNYALAFGQENFITSSSEYSNAIGASNNIEKAPFSLAFGKGNTISTGSYNYTFGNGNTINSGNQNDFAVGFNTIGGKENLFSFGNDMDFSNYNNGFALGKNTKISTFLSTEQADSYIAGNGGNVGIGTTVPAAQLHTTQNVIFGGIGTNTIDTKVMTTNASGDVTTRTLASLLTGTDSTTASNGLNLVGRNVRLGGALIQPTTITNSSQPLTFATGGTALNITGLPVAPSSPSITDSVVMINASTGLLRIMSPDSLFKANWNLKGNTVSSTDFLGTLNAQPINFKVNNIQRGTMGSESSSSYTTLNLNGSHKAKTFSADVTGFNTSVDLGQDGVAANAVTVGGTTTGIDNLNYIRSSTSTTLLRGLRNRIWAINNTAVANTDGIFNEYKLEGNGVRLTNVKNLNTELRTVAGATITNYYGMYTGPNSGGSPAITNFYGTYFTGGTSLNNMPNYYTHYQEDLGNSTTRYFLYYAGNGGTRTPIVANALGNFGLGVTNPTFQLHTTGTVAFTGLTSGTIPNDSVLTVNATTGQIYRVSASLLDSNIYKNDGTLRANRTVTMADKNLTFAATTGDLIYNPGTSAADGNMGVGTTTPDASAILDVTSANRGVLLPRMSTTQRTSITTPATGLLVFDNDTKSFWVNKGTSGAPMWVEIITGAPTVTTKTAAYTLTPADNGKIIEFNSTTAVNCTIPTGLPVGFQCSVSQLGTGQVTFVAGTGLTLRNAYNFTKMAAQWSKAGVEITSTATVAIISGDLQ
jgi:hypothetical protein